MYKELLDQFVKEKYDGGTAIGFDAAMFVIRFCDYLEENAGNLTPIVADSPVGDIYSVCPHCHQVHKNGSPCQETTASR